MSGVAPSASFEAKLCFVRKTTHDGDWGADVDLTKKMPIGVFGKGAEVNLYSALFRKNLDK